MLSKFVFMWNDGIAFFSTGADHKLKRILGKKPTWCDKWCSGRNLFMNFIEFTILAIVVGG